MYRIRLIVTILFAIIFLGVFTADGQLKSSKTPVFRPGKVFKDSVQVRSSQEGDQPEANAQRVMMAKPSLFKVSGYGGLPQDIRRLVSQQELADIGFEDTVAPPPELKIAFNTARCEIQEANPCGLWNRLTGSCEKNLEAGNKVVKNSEFAVRWEAKNAIMIIDPVHELLYRTQDYDFESGEEIFRWDGEQDLAQVQKPGLIGQKDALIDRLPGRIEGRIFAIGKDRQLIEVPYFYSCTPEGGQASHMIAE